MSDQNTDRSVVSVEVIRPEESGIGRRAVLQSLIGGLGAGVVLPVAADAHPMQQHLADHGKVAAADKKATTKAYKPEFLDAHQFASLEAIAERILPGSTKARVAPFVDQLLAVDTQTNQRNFFSALGAFDMQAIQEFKKPWKALTAAEQDQLLTAASTADSGRMPPGPESDPRRPGPGAGTTTIRDHFENLKGWVSGAYYSSEIGMRELGWTGQMFFEGLPGCDHPDGHA
jgi:hypothetical protein